MGSQMAVRLSALRAGRPLPPGRILVLISVRSLVDPRAIVTCRNYPSNSHMCLTVDSKNLITGRQINVNKEEEH
jgi:hypothetical protein